MSLLATFDRLERLILEERDRGSDFARSVGGAVPLRLDEIRASCALAGSALTRDEVAALVLYGRTSGSRPLTEYILVADYAEAAAYAASRPLPGARHRYIAVAELVELHARVLRRTPGAGQNAWRRTTVPPFSSGMVAPPAWLVPREIERFAERVGSGPAPGESPLRWAATAHERFCRIQPFERGNGRVGRLALNLLLHRLGLPPWYVAARERERYELALRTADARDHLPLATLIARSVLTNLRRLFAAVDRPEKLLALSELAEPHEREALYKAAQRGRLHSVRSGSTLLTTRASIEAYRASRSPAGRRGALNRPPPQANPTP